MSSVLLLSSSVPKPVRPPNPVRAPLPPFPSAPAPYVTALPWNPPETRDFCRGDAWGVEIPGLPWVPGGSSEHPERCLTWFLHKWDPSWQYRILKAHREDRGYTHFFLSWPDARTDGLSLQEFVNLCRRVKEVMPYVHVKLAAKGRDLPDQSPNLWALLLDSVMDVLLDAHVVDEFGVWEWNLFNVPGQWTIDTFRHLGQRARAGGCSFWAHFSPQVTSWFADGDPRMRFGFWQDLGTNIDGIDYQANVDWTVDELQARIVDTLIQFSNEGNVHKLRAWELTAWNQFTKDRPTEDEANMIGYLACCTSAGSARVWGYGNGARRPDGSVL